MRENPGLSVARVGLIARGARASPPCALKASQNSSRGHTSFDRPFLSLPSTARPFAGLSFCRRSSSCNTCSRWRAWSASACSHSWVIFCRGHVWSSQWRSRLRERAMILVHAREQWRGGQNRSAKNSNARHQADDKALRFHPPSTRGGLRAVKGKPRHHPFVGDYAIRLRARCRRSLLPRPPGPPPVRLCTVTASPKSFRDAVLGCLRCVRKYLCVNAVVSSVP